MPDMDTCSGVREILYSRIMGAICALELKNDDWQMKITKLTGEHMDLLQEFGIYTEDLQDECEDDDIDLIFGVKNDMLIGDINEYSENIQFPIDGYAKFTLWLKGKVVRIIVCNYTAIIYRNDEVDKARRMIPSDSVKADVEKLCQYINEV